MAFTTNNFIRKWFLFSWIPYSNFF